MTIEDRIDLYARRAGEAFIAASRTTCPHERARYRRTATDYVGLLRDYRATMISRAAG